MLPARFPDYAGGGLVNLVASIVASRGGMPRHATASALPASELAPYTNVVLLIVDGLGDRLLARLAAGGELARRRRAAMTSVFPSTTASAITTSYTGCTPLEHGLTGWYTYFGEAGYVAAPLPFRVRGDNIRLTEKGFSAEHAFPAASLFQNLPARSIVVTERRIIDSDYNVRHCDGAERVPYETIDELVAGVERAVKSGNERKFIYAYWSQYDAASHPRGCDSPEALAELARMDEAFGKIINRLGGTDSIVIATADHGFINAEDSLEPPASIASQLKLPLCGERRVAYCHVHSPADFIKRAQDWLGSRADVRPSRELVDEGWFGPGEPHPRLAERIGDVTLVMRGRHTVKDWTPGEPRHLHIGNHGGTSEDEMMIPVIVETP
jgi:hypothetical protein